MSKIKYILFPEAWGKEESAWFLGLNIKNTYTLEVKFNAVPWNAWTQFMGCLVNNDYDEFQFSIYQNENGLDFGQNYWDYGEGRLWSDALFPVSPNEDHVLIINVGSGDVNIDGNTYAGGGNNVSGTSYGPLWIGCAPSGFYDPGFTGRIYYLKIYENNTLIADYEAVSANNYVGFVDTVSGNYLTKGGNGTVIYGEESVTPPYVINAPAKQVVKFKNKCWPLPKKEKYKGLTFKSIGNTTVGMKNLGNNVPDLKYSLDNGSTWTLWDYSTISLNDGDEICFKGDNRNGFSTSSSKLSSFTTGGSGNIKATGNIMSIIDDGECNTYIIPCDWCFYHLFSYTSLVTSPKLPATTLKQHCYDSMFYPSSLLIAPKLPATTAPTGCYYGMFFETGIKKAPELPATTLGQACYRQMFLGCRQLIEAPVLPATTLAGECYKDMFLSCTSLMNAPELPATTLVGSCYQSMFANCTSLNYIKCLATNISATNCVYGWTYSVSSTGTFVKAASMTSWPTGTSGIPDGWTVQDA